MINTLQPSKSLRHPPGLRTLFFAEMWERFGFYCIQSLLVLYLVNKLLYSDTHAYGLFSAFSALIYATPVIGGYIADKLLGFRRAILLGGVLYAVGYFALAIPHNPLFYFALSLIIWGNGFFKSSVSSLLGKLYETNDPRRDSGFTLFYMGINLGSFISPIVCTYVAIHYGWNYGFGTAGIGMLIGIASCLYNFKKFGPTGTPPNPQRLFARNYFGLSLRGILYLSIFAISLITALLIQHEEVVNVALILFSIAALVFLLGLSLRYPAPQRNRLFALLILILFSIVFWAFYMQTYMSVTLFIERNVNRDVFGWQIPTAMFQSINPFFIIALSPLLAKFWLRIKDSPYNPSTSMKFALGLILISAGFFSLASGSHLAFATGLMAVGWVVCAYFFQTLGELSLSPIGLAAVTKLAPPNLVGMLMGVWFLALCWAYAIAGKIADLTSIPDTIKNPHLTAQLYSHNFFHFGLCALGTGFLLMLLTPMLKRLMQSQDKNQLSNNTLATQ